MTTEAQPERPMAGFDPDEKLPGPRSAWVVLALSGAGFGIGQLSDALAVVVTITCLAWFLVIVARAATLRGPSRPVEPPRLGPAPMPDVRWEPDRSIPVKSYHCRICGKPLTNEESQWAGVGTTCIRTHGPRPLFRPNPDHDVWVAEVARARSAQAAAEAELTVARRQALEAHEARVEEWEAGRWTPGAHARRIRRRGTAAFGIPALAWTAAGILSWIT